MSGSICIAKSLWGVKEASDVSQWDEMFGRMKTEGYLAVESILIFDANQNRALFRELLDKHGLKLFIQLHTASDWSTFNYCSSCELDAHVESFRTLLLDCLQLRPAVINVHSGHDSWDIATAVSYFEQVFAIERELLVGEHKDVILVHETHRQRLLFNPYQTRDILAHPKIAGKLRINCDLSHWVCVCEKVFDLSGADKRDAWWPALLETVSQHCFLIHARVGHAEGPQVVDPRSSSAAVELAAHMSWWAVIMQAQQLRDRGAVCYVTVEHGPEPYQTFDTPSAKSTLSEAEKSAVLWEINAFVKDGVLAKFRDLTA